MGMLSVHNLRDLSSQDYWQGSSYEITNVVNQTKCWIDCPYPPKTFSQDFKNFES